MKKFRKNIDIIMVKCYYVKKQITQDKIKEQKEYFYGTALQRVGDGEIPTGKYKGNGFVRCKANTDISTVILNTLYLQVADAVSSRYRGKISKRFRIG